MLRRLAFTRASDWLRGQDLNLRPSGYEHSELRTENVRFSILSVSYTGNYWKNPHITGSKNYYITTTHAFLEQNPPRCQRGCPQSIWPFLYHYTASLADVIRFVPTILANKLVLVQKNAFWSIS